MDDWWVENAAPQNPPTGVKPCVPSQYQEEQMMREKNHYPHGEGKREEREVDFSPTPFPAIFRHDDNIDPINHFQLGFLRQ